MVEIKTPEATIERYTSRVIPKESTNSAFNELANQNIERIHYFGIRVEDNIPIPTNMQLLRDTLSGVDIKWGYNFSNLPGRYHIPAESINMTVFNYIDNDQQLPIQLK